MLFQHLPVLYARYYLAKKKADNTKDLIEKEEALNELEEARKAYFRVLGDFEIYLDSVGKIEASSFDDLYDQIVYDPENENRMGSIRNHINNQWVIEWFDRNSLKFIEIEQRDSLSGLKIIKID